MYFCTVVFVQTMAHLWRLQPLNVRRFARINTWQFEEVVLPFTTMEAGTLTVLASCTFGTLHRNGKKMMEWTHGRWLEGRGLLSTSSHPVEGDS